MNIKVLDKSALESKEDILKSLYAVREEILYHPDIGIYHTYGILIMCGGMVSDVLHDVSPDINVVSRLVEQFNLHCLSPVHLYEAVTDMLP